jgi:hypothetical protein
VRETAGVPVVVEAAAAQAPGGGATTGLLPSGATTGGRFTGSSPFAADSGGAGAPSSSGAALDELTAALTGDEAALAAEPLTVSAIGSTPGGPLGAARFLLPGLLVLGLVAALGPALTRMRPRAAGPTS